MFTSKTPVVKASIVAAIVGIMMLATYAFASSVTLPTTYSGQSAATTTGFTVTGAVYNIDGTNPLYLEDYVLTISPAASEVNSRVVAAGTWISCTNGSATGGAAVVTTPAATWYCNPLTSTTVLISAMDTLEVSAVTNDQP